MNMDISIEDVKVFVASRGPNEMVGAPMSSGRCLVARALAWKYPELADKVFIPASNTYAVTGDRTLNLPLPFEIEVEEAANKFDTLGRAQITRAELEGLMPELFV